MRRVLLTAVLGVVLAFGTLAPTAAGHEPKDPCGGPNWEVVPAAVDPSTDNNGNDLICQQGKGQFKDDHFHPKK